MNRLLALLTLLSALLTATPALAQGCGPSNPNCVVPTLPFGTNDTRAASTAFVQQAGASAGGDGSINIINFGADPSGVNDSTAAIQSAIDFAFNNNVNNVFCPSGQYKTTQPIFFDPPGNMRGGGAWQQSQVTNYTRGSIVTYNSQTWALRGANDYGAPGEPFASAFWGDLSYQIVSSTAGVTYTPTYASTGGLSAVLASFKGSSIVAPTQIANNLLTGNTNGTASGSPVTTFSTAPIGSTVVVIIRGCCFNLTGGTSAVTDSAGNTYTKAAEVLGTSNLTTVSLWYSNNIANPLPSGGSITATIAGGSGGYFLAALQTNANGGVDKTGTASNPSATSVSIATGTLAQANEIVIGGVSKVFNNSPFSQAGFTTIMPSLWVTPATWSVGTTYALNDVVLFNGIPWISLQSNVGHTPSADLHVDIDPVWWLPTLTSVTQFGFTATFRGIPNLSPAGAFAGCRIQPTFNNSIAFVVASGNGNLVDSVKVEVFGGSGYHCSHPPFGAGFAVPGDGGGANRTKLVNLGVDNFYTGIALGTNGADTVNGAAVGLGAENKLYDPFIRNACVGVVVLNTQGYINYLIGGTIDANSAVVVKSSTGMNVYGGNYSAESATAPATSFPISGISVSGVDGQTVFTGTLTPGGDAWLTHNCTTSPIPLSSGAWLDDSTQCLRNVYNAWVVNTPDYGLIPLVLVSYNASTHVGQWQILNQWVAPYVNQINSHWQTEVAASTTIYAAEFMRTFVGVGMVVSGSHIETTAAFQFIDNHSGFGFGRGSSFSDIHFNISDLSQASTYNANPTVPFNQATFYAQQTFPFIDMSRSIGNVRIQNIDPGTADTLMFDYTGLGGFNSSGTIVFDTGSIPALGFRGTTGGGGTAMTGSHASLFTVGLGGGYFRYASNVSPTSSIFAAIGSGGWNGAQPFVGFRPAPWSAPCLAPSQLAILQGTLPALNGGPSFWHINYPVLWSGQQYKVCDWTLTPTAYNAGTSYAQGALVSSAGITYYSLINGNVGNTPASSPADWAPFHYGVVSNHGAGYSYGQNITNAIVSGQSWSLGFNAPFLMFSSTDVGLLFPGLEVALTYTGVGCSGVEHFIVREVHYTLHYAALIRAEDDSSTTTPQGGNAAGQCTNTTLGQAPYAFTFLN